MKKLLAFALFVLAGTVGYLSLSSSTLQERTPFELSGSTMLAQAAPVSPATPAAAEPAAAGVQPNAHAGTSYSAATNAAGSTSAKSVNTNSRPWDTNFLQTLYGLSPGATVQFELVHGKQATGTIRHIDRREGEVVYVGGELTAPEKGRFFFQKQTEPGKAGSYAGVVELPESKLGYRLEPTGPNGATELIELPLSNVVCMALPLPEAEAMEDAENIPPLNPSDFPDYPIPDYQDGIIPLQSLPGATAVVYIDYRGGYTPTWGGIQYDRPNVSNSQIRDVWKRVAEDFTTFNINVTTDIQVYERAAESQRQRCVVTPTTTAAPGAGGVAYLNSWNWTGDTPCWVFMVSGKSCAEAVSHEVGHTLQLGHDGTPTDGYYGGHGSGETGWAPIMGVGYYQPVSQWSKGEYANANNTQNDLTIIVGNNNAVDYRSDDTGPLLANSRHLEIYTNVALGQGLIETADDIDAFQFTTTGGAVFLRANPVGNWGNLAMQVTLHNASDTIIASNNPQTVLWASINTSIPAGTYTFKVKGVGRNNPLTTGFTSYGSIGYYSITGTVANARQPTRFTVAENAPSGTVVGQIPANNPSGNPLSYSIVSGNVGFPFSVDSAGVLRVYSASVLNYEALGANTQLPVQFELFVNITNLENPALTELNRRVVVALQDVNERPVTSNQNITVLERTRPGTLLTTVTATDPDFYNLLIYSLAGGDPNGKFSVSPATGEIRVAGELSRAEQSAYQLQVRVSDQVGPIPQLSTSLVSVVVLPNTSDLVPGGINYAVYTSISGTTISALTSAPSYPAAPAFEKLLGEFDADVDRGDNFGAVLRGYLIAPYTGNYTFWIASDDNGELWMSTSTNPAAISRIANVSGYTSPKEWNKYASQRSGTRTLVSGQAYYLEARYKEGSGGDHLSVAWTGPNLPGTNIISGRYLAGYSINYIPRALGFTNYVRRDLLTGAGLGRVGVADANAGDTRTFTILSGNDEGIFAIDQEGWVRVANATALQNTATLFHNLSVQALDNGTPALASTTLVGLNVVEPTAIIPTSLQRELFLNIGSGTAVNNLLTSSKYPRLSDEMRPMSNFSTPADIDNNYGSRVRGYVIPPVSGDYRFFIASDDASQLKLSTSDNPLAAVVIASVTGYSSVNQWTKEAGQTSAIRSLVAGRRYYIEALHKEGGGGDHLSVGWTGPAFWDTNVIEASYLEPADLNLAPVFNTQTLGIVSSAPNGTVAGYLAASDNALDTFSFHLVDGNTNNTFALDPATGALSVADNTLIADGSVSTFTLTVLVQDSGMGGLYPVRTAQNVVTVNVVTASAPLVWTGAGPANNWADPSNWRGLSPENGGRLIFGMPMRQTNLNDAVTTVTSVQMTNSGFELTGSPLIVQGGITNTGSNAWSIPTTLGAAQTWQHSGGGTWTINSRITNAGHNLGLAASGDVRLNARLTGSGGLTKSGTGRLLMQGAYDYTGVTVINSAGGTATAVEITGPNDLDLSGSDVALYGRLDLYNRNAIIGALAGSGMVFPNQGTRALILGASDRSGTFSGTLTNRSGSGTSLLALLKVGTGTQTLSGANGYSAGTTIRAGQITAGSASALGTGPVVLGDAGTGTDSVSLLGGAAVTINNPITVAAQGQGAATIGTVSFNPGTLNMQYSGTLRLERDVFLQGGSTERTTFAGPISGTGAITVTAPFGASRRVVLDRPSGISNSFAGPLFLDTNAWLQLGAATLMGNRTVPDNIPVHFAPNSRLRLAVTGGGDYEVLGSLHSLAPLAGVVDMVSGINFTLHFGADNADAFYSGYVINTLGTLNLIKTGTGRQVLAGSGSYTGSTTVSNGTLVIAHATGLGATVGVTVVAPGATLALSNDLTFAAEPISLNGTGAGGAGGAGALANESGTNVLTGPVSLAGPALIDSPQGALTLNGILNLSSHAATVRAAADAAVQFNGQVLGAGGLVKTGAGVLVLNTGTSYTGPTAIQAGILALGPSGTIPASSNITIAAGALLDVSAVPDGWVLAPGQTLDGNGTVAGATTLAGTLSPGTSIGTLVFSNNLALSGHTTMEVSRTGAIITNDLVRCDGTLTLGGTLTVLLTGDALLQGDTFKLFEASAFAPGTFATFEMPPLPGGLLWDVSRLAIDGTVHVTAEAPQPPTLSFSLSGGQITLSWPEGYPSYSLQAQTNEAGSGLTDTWYPVSGVTNNTLVTPLDPGEGSVFYRLFKE